jgi:glycerophosphoryl diester phosphodiesterase
VLAPVVWGVLQALRRSLPRRIGALLEAAGATAATLHWSVVSRAAVERCHARGAAVIAWTVDEPAVLARLDALGVDGVVTNDPRIFDSRLTE